MGTLTLMFFALLQLPVVEGGQKRTMDDITFLWNTLSPNKIFWGAAVVIAHVIFMAIVRKTAKLKFNQTFPNRELIELLAIFLIPLIYGPIWFIQDVNPLMCSILGAITAATYDTIRALGDEKKTTIIFAVVLAELIVIRAVLDLGTFIGMAMSMPVVIPLAIMVSLVKSKTRSVGGLHTHEHTAGDHPDDDSGNPLLQYAHLGEDMEDGFKLPRIVWIGGAVIILGAIGYLSWQYGGTMYGKFVSGAKSPAGVTVANTAQQRQAPPPTTAVVQATPKPTPVPQAPPPTTGSFPDTGNSFISVPNLASGSAIKHGSGTPYLVASGYANVKNAELKDGDTWTLLGQEEKDGNNMSFRRTVGSCKIDRQSLSCK